MHYEEAVEVLPYQRSYESLPDLIDKAFYESTDVYAGVKNESVKNFSS